MTRCPQCGTNYTDASLRFCLADGAALVKISDPMRVDIPSPESRSASGPAQHPPASSMFLVYVILATVTLGLFVVAAIVGVALYAHFGSAENEPEQYVFATPTPAVDSSRPASDEDILKTELEKLEKQLEDMDLPRVDKTPF